MANAEIATRFGTEVPDRRLTVEEFFEWGDDRARRLAHDEPTWELFDGVPAMQDADLWLHARVKLQVCDVFRAAIRERGLNFEVGIDGIGVTYGDSFYVPEVVVFPRGLIRDTDRMAPEPIIVVEVLSPSSVKTDLTTKAVGYGLVETIQHYLVVDPAAHDVAHFERRNGLLAQAGKPRDQGRLRLEPPGLEFEIPDFF